MLIKQAEFIISVAEANMLPNYNMAEIAIAGKSNVGKSSFINFITNYGKLARISSTPGRTRLINYFKINNNFYLVDLPGYGYAKASKVEQDRWGILIEEYLKTSINLKNIFVLLDIRHDPTLEDKQLITYLYHYNIPFTLVATKSDKLTRNELAKRPQEIASFLAVGVDNIIVVSSNKKTGLEMIDKKIAQILEN